LGGEEPVIYWPVKGPCQPFDYRTPGLGRQLPVQVKYVYIQGIGDYRELKEDRACPAYKDASERAKEAYTHRPRQFVVASMTASTSESNKGRMSPPSITQLSSSDGYATISRKKGRPPSCTVSITRFQSRASSSQSIQDYIRPRIGHAATSQPPSIQ
jgi:hypothetical protein